MGSFQRQLKGIAPFFVWKNQLFATESKGFYPSVLTFIFQQNSSPGNGLYIQPSSMHSSGKVYSHGLPLWKILIAAIFFHCMSQECSAATCLQLHPVTAFWERLNDCGRNEWAVLVLRSSSFQRPLTMPPQRGIHIDFHRGPPVHLLVHVIIQSANHLEAAQGMTITQIQVGRVQAMVISKYQMEGEKKQSQWFNHDELVWIFLKVVVSWDFHALKSPVVT